MIEDLSHRTDEELAAEAARESSDGPAFVAIVERFRQRVWRICYRLLCDEQDAADAAQEVFLRLFLHRGEFAGRSKYATWVHGVAVRTCLGMRRSRGRRRRHETAGAGAAVGSRGSRPAADAPPGLAMDLMKMLETLDEEDRAMLILKYAEGYDYEELAAIFELSVSACKMRVSRAREKLQQRYTPNRKVYPTMSSDFLDQLADLEVPPAAAGIRPQAAPARQPRAAGPAPAGPGGGLRSLGRCAASSAACWGRWRSAFTGRFDAPRARKRRQN